MFDYVVAQEERFCAGEGGTRAVIGLHPLEEWVVQTGRSKPLVSSALVVDVRSDERLDACLMDLALVELDRPLDIQPLALRLEAPPVVGEWGTLVGWGNTSSDGDQEAIPDERQHRQVRIEAVSPALYQPAGGTPRPLDPNSFIGTEGACEGDSGGPLISNETGAVIGIQYAVRAAILDNDPAPLANCVGGVSAFQRLDLQQQWIRSAFEDLGATPWVEGRQRPAAAGALCSDADDCVSGTCVVAGNGGFCAVSCNDGQCPDGFECVSLASEPDVCAPLQIDALDHPEDAGCTVDPSSGPRWTLWVSLLAVLRARRGRTRCEAT
jgi:hypothetical protein